MEMTTQVPVVSSSHHEDDVCDESLEETINRLSLEKSVIKLECSVKMTKKKPDNKHEVLKAICALLNSGGGQVVVKNEDFGNSNSGSKTLDIWLEGIEKKLMNILSCINICKYVTFSGTFNAEKISLLVKSAEHIITLEYNCYLPSDMAINSVDYKSVVELCSHQTVNKPLSFEGIPKCFNYGKPEETLKRETRHVQFKQITPLNRKKESKEMVTQVIEKIPKYISAFANFEGGRIYFGIKDNSVVYGESMTTEEEKDIETKVSEKMESFIFSRPQTSLIKGTHWDIQFVPLNGCPDSDTYMRKVIVVSICKMSVAVFEKCPESYYVVQNINTDGNDLKTYGIEKLEFDDWMKEVLKEPRDCMRLDGRYVKIPDNENPDSHSKLVCALPFTLQAAQEKAIKLRTGFKVYPKNVLNSYTNPGIKFQMKQLLVAFGDKPHLTISLDSWGLNLRSELRKSSNIKACFAIFSLHYGLHVVSFFDEQQPQVALSFTKEIAVLFEKNFDREGSGHSDLNFSPHVVAIQPSIKQNPFPPFNHQAISNQKIEKMLMDLTVAFVSYTPSKYSPNIDEQTNFSFLLTSDQLDLLWSHQYTRWLCVHGPAGTGKTVAALEMAKELRRRGCDFEKILFVAYNQELCSAVESLSICTAINQKSLTQMISENKDSFLQTYKHVKNVIVDEAQNFEDGNWYGVLKNLEWLDTPQEGDWTSGYFWLFWYSHQKMLPQLEQTESECFQLCEMSRNSVDIYKYAANRKDLYSQNLSKMKAVLKS